jgi:hypothetical protein
MNWVSGVWLIATAATLAVIVVLNGLFGIRWYAVAVGAPVFVIVTVAIPLLLGIFDRQKEFKRRSIRNRRRNYAPSLRMVSLAVGDSLQKKPPIFLGKVRTRL